MTPTVRPARQADLDDVAAIADRTWTDREQEDYLPAVFGDWLADPARRTVVVEADDRAVGVCTARLVSDDEAWLSGLRVHPDYRGAGHGTRLIETLLDWARDRGATVARDIVFAWNDAGLGQSLAAGFEPATAVRWAAPTPEDANPDATVTSDPDAAWRYWTHSDARTALSGLALAAGESWALAELSRERLERAVENERVFTVSGAGRGTAYRDRVREGWDDVDERIAEYGVAAWDGQAAADALVDAIRADAADLGADAARVLLPETPRHVAQAARARADLTDRPCYVLAADLTAR